MIFPADFYKNGKIYHQYVKTNGILVGKYLQDMKWQICAKSELPQNYVEDFLF